MPLYKFKKKSTNEVFEEFMSISKMEEKIKNSDIELIIGAPAIVSGVSVTNKFDSGWKDVLKKIKKANINSNINTL